MRLLWRDSKALDGRPGTVAQATAAVDAGVAAADPVVGPAGGIRALAALATVDHGRARHDRLGRGGRRRHREAWRRPALVALQRTRRHRFVFGLIGRVAARGLLLPALLLRLLGLLTLLTCGARLGRRVG